MAPITMNQTLFQHDGSAIYIPDAVSASETIWHRLASEVTWKQETITIFGKQQKVPRTTAYYGEFPYRYSGADHPACELPAVLNDMKKITAGLAATYLPTPPGTAHFNSVLCNRYQDGGDSMGWHRDNEREIDPLCIASVSFGGPRIFKLRHRDTRQTISIELESGSILLMIGCQDRWEHALPKTKREVKPRINLTYRHVLPNE